jgi:lipopolysaccharide transport system permease protein
MMVWYHVWPSWTFFALPIFTLLALLTSTGAGLWLSALTVKYRDFRYVVPFLVQFGLYVSPVGFSSSLIRDKLDETVFILYSLNPMVGVIDGFRWAVSSARSTIYLPGLIASLAVMLVLLATGVWYFRRVERTFADVI